MGTKLAHPPKIKPRNRARVKNTAAAIRGGKSASRESGGPPSMQTQSSLAPGDARSTAAPLHPFGEPVPATPPADPVAESIEPQSLAVLLEIERAERKVEDAERAWHSSREQTKELHKAFDTAVAQLRAVIKRRNQPLLPFDATTGEIKVEPEAWRRVSIDELGLKPRVAKALHDGGLDSIGDVADFHAEGNSLHRIKGLGDGAVDDVDDAMTKFWATHSEFTRPATEPEPSKADEASDDGDAAEDDED